MKHDEAMKLARDIKEQFPRLKDPLYVFELCDYVLSLGDMKREIENAAYERCEQIAITRAGIATYDVSGDYQDGESAGARDIANEINSLIQPPTQKEKGE